VGLDASANGRARLTGNAGASATLDLSLAKANLRTSYRPASDRPPVTLPATLTAQLALAEDVVDLDRLSGKIAGTEIVGGRIKIALAQPLSLEGELALSAIDFPAVLSTAIGAPPLVSGARGWPAEPFERGVWGHVGGSIALRIGRVELTPGLSATDMRATVDIDQDELSIGQIEGELAGGRIVGSLTFQNSTDGLGVDSRIRIAGADVQTLLADGALAGQAAADLSLTGTGRSPIALIGSLKGEGTFTLQDGHIARLDPSALDAVTRSVDEGLPIDVARIGERTEAALQRASLPLSLAQGEVSVVAGQLRIVNSVVRAKGADLQTRATIDLAGGTIDARLLLSGVAAAPDNSRPEVAISLRGPIGTPKRTLDVAAFANWLALRSINERSKRIDALETGREIPLAPAQPDDPAPSPGTPPPREVSPEAPPPRAPAEVPKSATRPRPKAQVIQPPPQAPPTDIRPAPAARPQPPAREAQPARPAPPPASRSWLENLFRP
jgi:hypothetical protein